MFEITKIIAREVIDSRGNPTVEAEIHINDVYIGRAIVPSGASVGKYEAIELRDNDLTRFNGKGVLKAVDNINKVLKESLLNVCFEHPKEIDKIIIDLDGTNNKSYLGANATLAVSIATYKAYSKAKKVPLYRVFGDDNANTLPIPLMNILNGGAHANNNLDIQEFMIAPIGANSFKEGLRMCIEVYNTLKQKLKKDGHITSVGDEGGFAPSLKDDEEALKYIVLSIKEANYEIGKDFMIALDVAASEWKENELYICPKSQKRFTSSQLIKYYESLIEKYPIFSIEDPLGEDDVEGWIELTQKIGNKVQLVGDDLFVTNPNIFQTLSNKNIANAILIKPNQIGTITETLMTIKLAKSKNYNYIISHRSGDSEDTTIAHISVGTNALYIKTGAPCRSERVAKYNELLRIEEELDIKAIYVRK